MSDKCNFNAFVDKKISKRNNTIDTIIDMQHEAKINLANITLSKYKPSTVIILNKNPNPAAPIAYFK